jgi:cell division protein ZapE
MGWVHRRSFQLTGIADPLKALARELSEEVRVLCFDELFVNDIGDAIILGRLFQVMFEQGVVVVCTSNLPPDQLYADGFNRDRFMPAITAIKQGKTIACTLAPVRNVTGWQSLGRIALWRRCSRR